MQIIIEKELESIILSATNGIFFTKGEIESNLLTTHTDAPKLYHWVNTIFNQLVIQFEPSNRCIWKITFNFTLFSNFLKWLKSVIFDKTSSGGNKRWNYKKKIHKILIGKPCLERNAIYYFYQIWFLLVLTCWKRNTFRISIKCHQKRGNLILKHYFLHHLICYIAHQWFIWTTHNLCFRIYFYMAPRRSK